GPQIMAPLHENGFAKIMLRRPVGMSDVYQLRPLKHKIRWKFCVSIVTPQSELQRVWEVKKDKRRREGYPNALIIVVVTSQYDAASGSHVVVKIRVKEKSQIIRL